ncbi:Sodium/hydrogen exchanger [Phlegmacium glaucopus]|nr:Sodium/hydrogen exchanger [Phlegmacium glaucopus]
MVIKGPVLYEVPSLPVILTISAFLYLLNVANFLFSHLINAGLLGPLLIGIIFGPQVANLLSTAVQETFILLGYIGLVLLVFEGGLTTDVGLLVNNLRLAVVAGLTGVVLPITLSLLLLHVGYRYPLLKAFASGASLCSTSLGTTLSLLSPEWRKTRVGAVLMSAALLDDVIGLVIAAIIANLSSTSPRSNKISWKIIVRPILVSLAFSLIIPLAAYILHRGFLKLPPLWRHKFCRLEIQLILIISTLFAFVAAANYAGTSELFGAYLAGIFLNHIFDTNDRQTSTLSDSQTENKGSPGVIHPSNTASLAVTPPESPTLIAFSHYLSPILIAFFYPVFFSSIGTALPIDSLFSIHGSSRVVWRGIVFSIIMILAKAAVGVLMLIWPDVTRRKSWFGYRIKKKMDKKDVPQNSEAPAHQSKEPTTTRSACLLGLALVARGEIALIVAELARPILVGDSNENDDVEPFAVVIWAILLSTVGGALGVGLLLRSWK